MTQADLGSPGRAKPLVDWFSAKKALQAGVNACHEEARNCECAGRNTSDESMRKSAESWRVSAAVIEAYIDQIDAREALRATPASPDVFTMRCNQCRQDFKIVLPELPSAHQHEHQHQQFWRSVKDVDGLRWHWVQRCMCGHEIVGQPDSGPVEATPASQTQEPTECPHCHAQAPFFTWHARPGLYGCPECVWRWRPPSTRLSPEGSIETIKDLRQAAPGAGRDPQGWQPIETVKREQGVDILIYADGITAIAYWGGAHADDWRCALQRQITQPTHWQPLPAAPLGAGEPSYFCTGCGKHHRGPVCQAVARDGAVPPLRPNRFDCPACGQGIGVDEAGCCRTCGRDATVVRDGAVPPAEET